jgi:hypothetical protein
LDKVRKKKDGKRDKKIKREGDQMIRKEERD